MQTFFLMEDPKQSLPLLLRKIEDFGQLAGLYINKNKSKLLLKNIRREDQEAIEKLSECEVVQKNQISRSRIDEQKYIPLQK